MCGRFTRMYTWRQLIALYRGLPDAPQGPNLPELPFEKSYNVAPSQTSPVLRLDDADRPALTMMEWGLLPHWADDPKTKRQTLARSEEARSRPTFRDAAATRRCLIPVSGFYEWQERPGSKTKQPWYIARKGHDHFSLAGLWERWERAGAVSDSFAILTCAANDLMAPLNDRMPVIVPDHLHAAWLTSPDSYAQVCRPLPSDQMAAIRVSTRVNSTWNNDPSLVTESPPVGEEPTGLWA